MLRDLSDRCLQLFSTVIHFDAPAGERTENLSAVVNFSGEYTPSAARFFYNARFLSQTKAETVCIHIQNQIPLGGASVVEFCFITCFKICFSVWNVASISVKKHLI